MKYSESIIITLPRFRVAELLDSIEYLPQWQPDLIDAHRVEGGYRQEGSKCELRYKMGNREMVIMETIIERKLPDSIIIEYQTDEVWSQLQSHFSETENGDTLWTINCEFRCRGFMKLMSWLMPQRFNQETQHTLAAFKQFAENFSIEHPSVEEPSK